MIALFFAYVFIGVILGIASRKPVTLEAKRMNVDVDKTILFSDIFAALWIIVLPIHLVIAILKAIIGN